MWLSYRLLHWLRHRNGQSRTKRSHALEKKTEPWPFGVRKPGGLCLRQWSPLGIRKPEGSVCVSVVRVEKPCKYVPRPQGSRVIDTLQRSDYRQPFVWRVCSVGSASDDLLVEILRTIFCWNGASGALLPMIRFAFCGGKLVVQLPHIYFIKERPPINNHFIIVVFYQSGLNLLTQI